MFNRHGAICNAVMASPSLLICSAWWRQTLWTTARTPWRGQSTLPAAPCVHCSEPPPPHASTLKDVKLSLVSIPWLFFSCWRAGDRCKSVFSVFLCVGKMKNRLCGFKATLCSWAVHQKSNRTSVFFKVYTQLSFLKLIKHIYSYLYLWISWWFTEKE